MHHELRPSVPASVPTDAGAAEGFDAFLECADDSSVRGPVMVRLRIGGELLAAMVDGTLIDKGLNTTPVCCDWATDGSDTTAPVDDWGFAYKRKPDRFTYVLISGRYRLSVTPEVTIEHLLAVVAAKIMPSSDSPKHGLRWHGGALCVSSRRPLDEFCADVSRLYPMVGARQAEPDMRHRIDTHATGSTRSSAGRRRIGKV